MKLTPFILVFSVLGVRAEVFPDFPSPKAALNAMSAYPQVQRFARASHSNPSSGGTVPQSGTAAENRLAAKPAAQRQWVRIEVRTFSDGAFSFWEPSLNLDVRSYKTWRDDFDFQLIGRVDSEDFAGDARSRFMRDPSWGYNISGRGYNAVLDKFGNGWILSGSYDRQSSDGRTTRQSFNYRIDRDFPSDRYYRVWERGIDVRIETTSFSASLNGTFDPALATNMDLALLATAAGLINQPKLQDPRRP